MAAVIAPASDWVTDAQGPRLAAVSANVGLCQHLAGRLTKVADNESLWTDFKLDLCYSTAAKTHCIQTTDKMDFYGEILVSSR